MCGVISLVSGVLAANADPEAEAADYAVAILGNVPDVLAFGNTKTLVEATDGGSAALSAGFGFFSGVTGAAVYGSN